MIPDADIGTWDAVIRLAVAVALGGLIGIERESQGHDAGIRTHVMLALGSALFGLVSIAAFDAFLTARGETNVTVDPSRIASYVAAGIGFLGAGAIIKHVGGVRGLTTAASIWATAAIGLAAGLGYWAGALAGAALAVFSLWPLRWLRDHLMALLGPRVVVVTVVLTPSGDPAEIVAVLAGLGEIPERQIEIGTGETGATEIRAEFREAQRGEIRPAAAPLARREGVADVVIRG